MAAIAGEADVIPGARSNTRARGAGCKLRDRAFAVNRPSKPAYGTSPFNPLAGRQQEIEDRLLLRPDFLEGNSPNAGRRLNTWHHPQSKVPAAAFTKPGSSAVCHISLSGQSQLPLFTSPTRTRTLLRA